MTTSIVKLPFVAGLDTGADPSAWGETGKLRQATNVYVAAAGEGALQPRKTVETTAYAAAFTTITQPRASTVEGRATVTHEDGIFVTDDYPILRRTNYHGMAQIASVEAIEQVPDMIVQSQAYAEGSALSGGIIQAGSMSVMFCANATTFKIVSRARWSGVVNDNVTVDSGALATYFGRIWLLWSSVTNKYILIRMTAAGLVQQTADVDQFTTVWSAATLISATLQPLDVQRSPDGVNSVLGYDSGTGDTILLRLTDAGAISQTITVATAPNAPQAGAIAFVDASTRCHVWTAGATGDGDNVRVNRINAGGTVSGPSTLSFPAGATAPTHLAAGADTAVVDVSYCLAVYAGTSLSGPDVVGSMLKGVFTAGIVQTNVAICPIIPKGRLWVDSTQFRGVRIWGSRGTMSGMWEFELGDPGFATIGAIAPIAIHTSLRTPDHNFAATATYAFPRSIWISGAESKCLLPVTVVAYNTTTCELVHVAPSSSMGVVVESSGRGLLLSGAPRIWDGSRFQPAGISPAPRASYAVSGGGFLSAGVYLYALVWEWTDARGLRQQSAPTLYTVTSGALGTVTFTLSSFHSPIDDRLWDASGSMTLVIYRSAVGALVYQRQPYSTTRYVLDAAAIATSLPTVVDNSSDALYAGNEPLYTAAGELEAIQAEASFAGVGVGGRLLGVLSAFPNQIWYSKEIQDGRAIEYNPALTFVCPGPLVAIAAQDGNVYAIGRNEIWAFAPSFADDTGGDVAAVDPTTIGQGIGCAQAPSVVTTPVGIIFWGDRGPYLLQRGGGAPIYIGAQVEGSTVKLTTVHGAAHNSLTNEVAFVGDAGRVLVFNYLQKIWYSWDLLPGYPGLSCSGGAICFDDPVAGRIFAFYDPDIALTLMRATDFWPLRDLNLSAYIHYCVIELGLASFGDVAADARIRTLVVNATGPAGATYTVEERDEAGNLLGSQNFACDDGPSGIYQVVQQKNTGARFTIRSPQAGSTVRADRFYGAELEVAKAGRNQVRTSLRKG